MFVQSDLTRKKQIKYAKQSIRQIRLNLNKFSAPFHRTSLMFILFGPGMQI